MGAFHDSAVVRNDRGTAGPTHNASGIGGMVELAVDCMTGGIVTVETTVAGTQAPRNKRQAKFTKIFLMQSLGIASNEQGILHNFQLLGESKKGVLLRPFIYSPACG